MPTEELISKIIRSGDFDSLKHAVLVRNDTSGTFILDEKRVHLLQFLENGVVLIMPPHSCIKGHLLSLFIIRTPLPKKITFIPASGGLHNVKNIIEVVGKVADMVQIEGTQENTVTVTFTQYDEKKWRTLVRVYQEHQELLNEIAEQNKI